MANNLFSRQCFWFLGIVIVLTVLAVMGVAMVNDHVPPCAAWVEYDTAELMQPNLHPMQLFIK